VDKKDIAALLDGLCERPLADAKAAPSAELQAFCGAAKKALSPADDIPAAAADDNAQADRLRAAFAAVLSGESAEGARHVVEDAALQSAGFRLDAQSALAFVDALEQAPLSAPAHLVDEMMTADATRAAPSAVQPRQTAIATIGSLIGRGSWSARRWRMAAAACTVLLVAGASSWSVYWQRSRQEAEGSPGLPAVEKTRVPPPVRAAAPASLDPVVARAQPCESRSAAEEAAKAPDREPSGGAPPAGSEAGAECSPGHQFADRPAEEIEAIAARARLEAARKAAAERAAAEAAGKVGAAPAGSGRIPVVGERAGPSFGATGRDGPAAATSVPSAPSQYGVAPPAAAPAVRPNAVGR
jgi:hypothetical protein